MGPKKKEGKSIEFYKFEDPFVLIVAKDSKAALEVYDGEIGDVEELTTNPEKIDREEATLILSRSTDEGEYRKKLTGVEEAATIIDKAITDINSIEKGYEFNLGHVLALSEALL
ncbi:hypothetical protein [Enterococcus rotai]|uniref:hypothetical protein n=1 Tax=Enterococcus rotai TaxID=118060 RepID=UPI0035C76BC0